MKKIARFGHVWKNKKTDKIEGATIDVKTIDELQEYIQVPKEQEKTAETPSFGRKYKEESVNE